MSPPKLRHRLLPAIDLLFAPVAGLAARCLYLARRCTLQRLPRSARAIARGGIYPLIDHYYEPLIHPERLAASLDAVRDLPGLAIDLPRHLAFLEGIPESRALQAVVAEGKVPNGFRLDNTTFPAGDAEALYGIVRALRPRRVVEIGCGNSTLVLRAALAANAAEGAAPARHICIEPYEVPWLESLGVEVVRSPVEAADPALFDTLEAGDILFIDSSHMIRPQGDVLHEIQVLLPRLRPGVVVHVHDIFTPRDYPADLLVEHRVFWNEQYLLEAFLAFNAEFEVLLPLNHLWHEERAAVLRACPGLAALPEVRPASFWLRRRAPAGAMQGDDP